MSNRKKEVSVIRNRSMLVYSLILLVASAFADRAAAHCDTIDGPVTGAAREALEKKDVTPVLKWVSKDQEAEVRSAFSKVLTARESGGEAREVADRWFLETVVRLHRQGEGEPYAGLKPAETTDPVTEAADKALATGSVEQLSKDTEEHVREALTKRFKTALAAKQHADDSIDAGRNYVQAYTSFLRFLERLHNVVKE